MVLSLLGSAPAPLLTAALERAGARIRHTRGLVDARRASTQLGSAAAAVVSAPADTPLLRAGLRALHRQAAVVVVLEGATAPQRADLLTCGADYVLSSGEAVEVTAALAAVLRRSAGQRRCPPEVVAAGGIRLRLMQRTATAGGEVLDLTALEFDLLAYFVQHPGQALSRQRLLSEVWGYDVGGLGTVTVHVRRLRRKIEVDPAQPLLLRTVWRVGYRLDPTGGRDRAPRIAAAASP